MRVYRVENDVGGGFYSNGFYGNFPPVQYWWELLNNCKYSEKEEKCALTYFINNLHPRNREFDKVCNESGGEYYFGFTSVYQLKRWFPESILNNITKFGGSVKVYEVSNDYVRKDSFQCIFNKGEASLIEILPKSSYQTNREEI